MMKNTLIAFTLLLSLGLSAQKIKVEKVTFNNIRLPFTPIQGELEGYSFTVETPYPENTDNIVADAKKRHEAALVQYEKDVEAARENFKIESEQYNSLTMVERLAKSDQKPQLRLPRKPVYYEPSKSNIIVYNPQVLAGSYLRLDGYSPKTDGNILTGMVVINEFDKIDPVRKSEQKSYYNSTTKQTEKKTEYYYITSYKQPTYVKLEYGGSVLFEGMLEETSEYAEKRTAKAPNMISLEKESVEASLSIANEFINDNYGFSSLEYTYDVRYEKNKGGDYDDMEEAKEIAVAAYKDFGNGENASALDGAIKIWQQMLNESDLDNKKARVNAKITYAVLANLIEADIAKRDYVEATKYLDQMKDMKLNYAEKQYVEVLEDQIVDLKQRVEANS